MIRTSGVRRHDTQPLAVSIEDVHKAYRRGTTCTPVLTGIDLEIRRGECVFLVGPSGSGKTTLLSIIGCILSADRGRLRLLDEDIHSLNPRQCTALRRDRLGFVFQRFHLIRGLSALDNVCVPLTLQESNPRRARKRATTVLEAVGLADKANAHPRNLSAGQCQRVALARALVGDPDLILADEPTASLDAANGQQLMELLRHLTSEQGKTAVVVTHDPRVFRFADRVFRLENGRLAHDSQSSPAPFSGANQ